MYRSGLAWALVLVVVVLLVPTLGPERVTPPARAATPRFTVTDLGTLGGATSAAYAINSAGQVAGDSLLPDGHTHAFVWGSGVMTDICPKCLDSHANAINAQGQVTGWATGLQSDDAFPKAFLYTPGQGTVLLPYLASYYTFGYGINDNGWVVGYQYIQCVGCYEEPILWKDGVRERIGPGSYTGPRGVAWGVNNVGQATGRSLAWYPQPDHAFLFDRGTGTLTDLGVPPGFEDSEGYAVTDTGTVVGRASMHGGAPAHPIVWRPSSGSAPFRRGLQRGEDAQARASTVHRDSMPRGGPLAAWWEWVRATLPPRCLPTLGCLTQAPEAKMQGSGYQIIDLGAIGGLTNAVAWRMTRYGQILGCARNGSPAQCLKQLPSTTNFLAAVPDQGAPIKVDLAGLVGPPCTVSYANDMNAQGQIAATGPCGGVTHAQLLTPIQVNTPNYLRVLPCLSPIEGLKAAGVGTAASVLSGFSRKPLVVILATGSEVVRVVGLKWWVTKCGGDPFDPNFATVFSPQFRNLPTVPAEPSCPPGLDALANQALSHEARAIGYLQALYVTMNREQSAFSFGRDDGVTLQDPVLGNYADGIVSELRAAQAGMQSLASAVVGTACDESVTQENVAAFLLDVRQRGVDALPTQEVSLISMFGLDPASVIPLYDNVDPTQVPLSLSNMMRQMADSAGYAASLLERR